MKSLTREGEHGKIFKMWSVRFFFFKQNNSHSNMISFVLSVKIYAGSCRLFFQEGYIRTVGNFWRMVLGGWREEKITGFLFDAFLSYLICFYHGNVRLLLK